MYFFMVKKKIQGMSMDIGNAFTTYFKYKAVISIMTNRIKTFSHEHDLTKQISTFTYWSDFITQIWCFTYYQRIVCRQRIRDHEDGVMMGMKAGSTQLHVLHIHHRSIAWNQCNSHSMIKLNDNQSDTICPCKHYSLRPQIHVCKS